MSDRLVLSNYPSFSDEVGSRKWKKDGTPRSTSEILGIMSEEFNLVLDELKDAYRRFLLSAREKNDTTWLPANDDVIVSRAEEGESGPPLPRHRTGGLMSKGGEVSDEKIMAPADLQEPYEFLLESSRGWIRNKNPTVSNPYWLLSEKFGRERVTDLLPKLRKHGLLEIIRGMRGALAPRDKVQFGPEVQLEKGPSKPGQASLVRLTAPEKGKAAGSRPATPASAVVQRTREAASMSKFQLKERQMEAFLALWSEAVRLSDGRGVIAAPTGVLSRYFSRGGVTFLMDQLRSVVKVLDQQESNKIADDLGLKLRSSQTRVAILAPQEQVGGVESRSACRPKSVTEKGGGSAVAAAPKAAAELDGLAGRIRDLEQGQKALCELIRSIESKMALILSTQSSS